MAEFNIFLSSATGDFGRAHRDPIREALESRKVRVHTQETIKSQGGATSAKLDDYIKNASAVVHVIGPNAGAPAPEGFVAVLLERYPNLAERLPWLADTLARDPRSISYTQWEAYLALLHRRPLFCYAPSVLVAVDPDQQWSGDHSQFTHLQRLRARNIRPTPFESDYHLMALAAVETTQLFLDAGLPPLASVDLSKLPTTYAKTLYGRDREMAALVAAWDGKTTKLFAFDAIGGQGKTALVTHFVERLKKDGWHGAANVYAWSFYSQGSNEDRQTSADDFFKAAFAFFSGGAATPPKDAREKGVQLAALVQKCRALLILDGLEPLQYAAGTRGGAPDTANVGGIKDPGIKALLKILSEVNPGLVIVTTRIELTELDGTEGFVRFELAQLPLLEGIRLLRDLGVAPDYPPKDYPLAPRAALTALRGPDGKPYAPPAAYDPQEKGDRAPMPAVVSRQFADAVHDLRGHALALTLVGNYLVTHHAGDIRALADLPSLADLRGNTRSPFRVMRAIEIALCRRIAEDDPTFANPAGTAAGKQLALLFMLGLFDRPMERELIPVVFARADTPLEPEAADLAAAATDLVPIMAQIEALDAEAQADDLKDSQRLRITRDRKAAIVERDAVYEAQHRVIVRRLFRDMVDYTAPQHEKKITEALASLADQGLVARTNEREAWKRSAIDCHPLVREYFGTRLCGSNVEEFAALDLATFQAAHGRLYDHYRYAGLPTAFREPVAYAFLANGAAYPNDVPRLPMLAELLISGQEPKGWDVAPILLRAGKSKFARAKSLIDGPQWHEAMTAFRPEDEAGMTPLFAAIGHGCLAGRQDETFNEVYWPRITRGNDNFATQKLGLYGQDLAALASFFDTAFTAPSPHLSESDQALALNLAGFRLRALGRLEDAVAPMRTATRAYEKLGNLGATAICAGNLAELLLTLGRIDGGDGAVAAGRQAIIFSDRTDDLFQQLTANAANAAPALLAAGNLAEAEALLRAAEALQKQFQPELPRLYSTDGFALADLLLARGRVTEARERGNYALRTTLNGRQNPLDIALARLTKARAAPASSQPRSGTGDAIAARGASALAPDHASRASNHPVQDSTRDVALTRVALDALRKANQEQYIPSGLIAHAEAQWRAGDDKAADEPLREAEAIATRGPMPLFMAECKLLRARMALAAGRATDARAHRDAAAALIDKHHWRRALPELAILDAEIADAERATDLPRLLDAAMIAIRGTPYHDDRTGLTIDGGWWGLMPRLDALLPADHPARSSLDAARKAYNDERDAYLAATCAPAEDYDPDDDPLANFHEPFVPSRGPRKPAANGSWWRWLLGID